MKRMYSLAAWGYLLCLNSMALIGAADIGFTLEKPNGVSWVCVSAAIA